MRNDLHKRLRDIQRIAHSAADGGSALTAQNAVRSIADLAASLCTAEEIERHAPTLQEKLGGGHPPLPAYLVAAVQAASRLLTFSNIDPIPVAVGAVPGASNPYKMTFQAGEGWIIGMRGSVVDQIGYIFRSSIGLQLELNGNPLITDGDRAQFANFDDLFTSNQVYCPLRRFLTTDDILEASFENYSPDEELTPTLTIFFCRLRDIEEAYAAFASILGC